MYFEFGAEAALGYPIFRIGVSRNDNFGEFSLSTNSEVVVVFVETVGGGIEEPVVRLPLWNVEFPDYNVVIGGKISF